ncbi:hypothetical protein AN8658.2 [Aspergillus nidulans FGSC A4]|uniref:NADP-dependent oxidoreductase domain-containing protein n=1 Tax=Emericella nidulans (strain FGSC A4 / ATCC 38163 / CBS 112.46 / NRRL 194 / M139) TaxID=227321 RepID=Q5ASS2_EMENI|nr:hypothetical protein [Aspergillus nidulans FGSC A4]EAA60692.1 hypothetical protein AN8658.2 [Aspergillus nidulans FGSC A4]CBF78238.1 TPA: conserved hypothetical protein [Aspergillus nidulans FGSC A4]|eukprot:XP_681927.1 hypothetical protein AN8658.2 [Aspergillus nidulans FGSC A4]
MMTDNIVASLPLDELRSIMRSLLTIHPSVTPVFEEQTRNYLDETTSKYSKIANAASTHRGSLCTYRTAYAEWLGVDYATRLCRYCSDSDSEDLAHAYRDKGLTVEDTKSLWDLQRALPSCREVWEGRGGQFPSLVRIAETFTLDADVQLPRIFTGLLQISSLAWGSASRANIFEQFSRYVSRGFTAFNMADYYGDAEIIFGRYRSSSAYADSIFAATKYCVFHPITLSEEAMRASYEDDQYIMALQYLQQDPRAQLLGLCNFDTKHMRRVIESGVKIVSNQVQVRTDTRYTSIEASAADNDQFSLIDSRPIVKMAGFCSEHNIKLLTYGTLCGGLLAEKWLDQAPPDLYSEKITPSQRKYYASIRTWGAWPLFQELLRVLKVTAYKHSVTISKVVTRWVLDFPYVGAVIVGCRMGVSEQSAENLASLGWCLDEEDRQMIEGVMQRSQRKAMFESLGDCVGEYR